MIHSKIILIIFLATALFGCDFMEYDDISSEELEAPLINTKYKSQKILFIYGITLDRNYKKVIDYYTIKEPPGIGGPEVLSKDILPIGTLIKIIKVERCNNCFPFPAEKRLVIEILSNTKFNDKLVAINHKKISADKTGIFTKVE